VDRKEFLKICGGACIGLAGLTIAQSCKPTKHVLGTLSGSQLRIDKSEFKVIKGEKTTYRKSIITKPENSDYPIVVYRFSETNYTALLLRCTHQNNELTMNGDILTCPAHGSEFSNRGEAIQGPAEQKLQTFKVTTDEKYILIQLT
jgi:Rieske Fe-S protein